MAPFSIRTLEEADRAWLRQFWQEHWGADFMVLRGETIYPDALPGFLAVQDSKIVGLATYALHGETAELISLDSLAPGQGVGAGLVDAVSTAAREAGCQKLIVVTTNDNLNALRFYQKHGFRLARLRPGAVTAARLIKPTISEMGEFGIPIRDEIELEKDL
jgi:ribosomal protein S18 acetylase RimI-like enzyme